MLNRAQGERHVTLDIDVADLRQRAHDHGLPVDRIVVPLATRLKIPVIDVDARDAAGQAIALVPSGQDARVAQAVILASIGDRVRDLSEDVRTQMYELIRDGSSSDLLDLTRFVTSGALPGEFVGAWDLTDEQVATWRRLLGDEKSDLFDALEIYAAHHLMLTELTTTPTDTVRVLKYRMVETQVLGAGSFSPQLNGLAPLAVLLPMGSADSRTHTHIRFKPPRDLLVSAASLRDLDAKVNVRVDQKLVTPDIAAFYLRKLPAGRYALHLELSVRRVAFVFPALMISAFTTVLLGIGALLELFDGRFSSHLDGSPQGTPDAAVTILSLVPTLLILVVIRAGEHPMVARLLLLPRLGLGLSGALSIGVGAAVAADVGQGWLSVIFGIAALVSLAATLTLVAIFLRTSHNWRRWVAAWGRFLAPLTVRVREEQAIWRTRVDGRRGRSR
jgi:hypothetical protein